MKLKNLAKFIKNHRKLGFKLRGKLYTTYDFEVDNLFYQFVVNPATSTFELQVSNNLIFEFDELKTESIERDMVKELLSIDQVAIDCQVVVDLIKGDYL